MRRIAALMTCFALVLAFGLAPFQHVHSDHDHAGVLHAHFFPSPFVRAIPHGAQIDDNDDHSSAKSVDTFTLVFASRLMPVVLPRGPVLYLAVGSKSEPVIAIEERTHDPPGADRSLPRAPPV